MYLIPIELILTNRKKAIRIFLDEKATYIEVMNAIPHYLEQRKVLNKF